MSGHKGGGDPVVKNKVTSPRVSYVKFVKYSHDSEGSLVFAWAGSSEESTQAVAQLFSTNGQVSTPSAREHGSTGASVDTRGTKLFPKSALSQARRHVFTSLYSATCTICSQKEGSLGQQFVAIQNDICSTFVQCH